MKKHILRLTVGIIVILAIILFGLAVWYYPVWILAVLVLIGCYGLGKEILDAREGEDI